jgi:hypothetical protein
VACGFFSYTRSIGNRHNTQTFRGACEAPAVRAHHRIRKLTRNDCNAGRNRIDGFETKQAVHMLIDQKLWGRVDDFRFENRFTTRTEVIRWLMEC